jgi:SAM-dependent methyltransferase
VTLPKFKDHFSAGSEEYAAYRPTYPARLVHELANVSPSHKLALDCGCGTGQLSVLLAARFESVIAIDASAAQIDNAEPHTRVRYCTALAEESGLEDSSADLITVAQAAHWLDLEKFYTEVRRIARSNGVLTLISYGVLHVEGDGEPAVQKFYSETVGPYWPPERRQVEDGYRNLPFPFREIPFPSLSIEVSWTLADLIGYIGTWSATKAAEKALGTNPVVQFEREMRECWGDPKIERRVEWPLSVRVGYV